MYVNKYARNEDVPEHTLFVITTDGMENASRRYDSETVKKMIERQKEKYGWEFLFLGANIDAVETAKHFGIGADRAVNYHSDHTRTTSPERTEESNENNHRKRDRQRLRKTGLYCPFFEHRSHFRNL